jgi:hypothetical protein
VLARGTQSPILSKVEVWVIIQLHQKRRHQNVTNPISTTQKVNTEICIKANISKLKAKTELFPKDYVLELNTKNLSNSPSFLANTQVTLSTECVRSYRILTINVSAEFCTWTEQWQNGSSVSSLGLAETPKILNAILEDNPLSFPMVY